MSPVTKLPTAPPPVKPPVTLPPRAAVGINLAGLSTWGGERTLMNLALNSPWKSQRPGVSGWVEMDPSRMDANGDMKALLTSELANKALTPPEGAYGPTATRIRCTWKGKGTLAPGGSAVTNLAKSTDSFEFDWAAANGVTPKSAWVTISKIDTTDPLRKVDCREKDASPTAMFSSKMLESLKGFSVIRFLDWQKVNTNAPVSWATRTTAESTVQNTDQGPAVEIMVALANEAGIDPWFHMHWNADEEYVRRFAEYVRDHLAPGRKVYVEMSNEVWNYNFPVTNQAQAEGVAEGLSPTAGYAMFMRYAEKATWMNKIWTDVFKADPSRLVRIVATQNNNPAAVEMILGFRDTAQYVDAVSTAPYFGGATFAGTRATITDSANIFAFLSEDVDLAISKALKAKVVAQRYGKRYIGYEGGQHVVNRGNPTLVAAINRDPRMYDMYRKYLTAWNSQIGDLMTLYAATGSFDQYGAWGLREYTGQSLAETPKRRAVQDYLSRAY